MTLTIYKNDEFKTIGFTTTEKVYDKQFLRHHEVTFHSYGILNGWSKEVNMTSNNLELIKRIMDSQKRISDLKDFQWMFFTIAKENDWYKNQSAKMKTIDKEIEYAQGEIENALQRLG